MNCIGTKNQRQSALNFLYFSNPAVKKKSTISMRYISMKRIVLLTALSGLFVFTGCSSESSPFTENTDMVVVRAYVYANESVHDIKITSTIALGGEDQSGPPINDAQVTLIKNGNRYVLELSPGDSGYYRYNGSNLTIQTGDQLKIEVYYFDKIAFGETTVPPPPANVSISRDVVIVPEIGGFGFGQGGFTIDTTVSQTTVEWDNIAASLHFVTMENLESNPQPVYPDRPFIAGKRFLSQPTSQNSYTIRFNNITHLGKHSVKVYRINQEYADLYQSRTQDSRDLNEPLTNIINGLGVFSAFNSDSVLINVIEQ